jgi:hypothetical protein
VTPDPLTAALDQLAAHHEHISQLDAREADHFAAISRRLAELTDATAGDADTYQPRPAPAWWKLPTAERQEPLAQLRAWVEQIYRPGYGHLAATLGPCWESHDLCLYGLDILSQLWSALYLQPQRTTGLLSAQAEYQARLLPALAEQLRAETNRCGHPRSPGPLRSTR